MKAVFLCSLFGLYSVIGLIRPVAKQFTGKAVHLCLSDGMRLVNKCNVCRNTYPSLCKKKKHICNILLEKRWSIATVILSIFDVNVG